MADAKYLNLLISCLVFWAIIAFGLSALSADDMFSGTTPANASYGGAVNTNLSVHEEEDFDLRGVRDSPIVDTLIGLFGFRLYTVFDMPTIMSFIISLLNYLLVVIAFICIYRLVNPIA